MAKKLTWKQLSPQEFSTIKKLQQAGLKVSKTADVTGRSWGTIKFIYDAETLADYQKQRQESNAKSRKPSADVAQPRPEQPLPKNLSRDASELLLELHRQNVAIQERQAVALEALVQAWNSSPAKKKLF